jgi:NADH-quinone oxidoreductase subunit G
MAARRARRAVPAGADEIEIAPAPSSSISARTAIAGAHRADVILPGAAYPENPASTSTPRARADGGRASFPPGEAREDWAILRALSDVLGASFLRLARAVAPALFKAHPHLQRIDQIAPGERPTSTALPARRRAGQGAVRLARSTTSTSPIRSRARPRHGGMLGARRGHARSTAAE